MTTHGKKLQCTINNANGSDRRDTQLLSLGSRRILDCLQSIPVCLMDHNKDELGFPFPPRDLPLLSKTL